MQRLCGVQQGLQFCITGDEHSCRDTIGVQLETYRAATLHTRAILHVVAAKVLHRRCKVLARSEMILELLLGTRNPGKVAEIRKVLGDLDITFLTLENFPHVRSVKETGRTYEENARLKASSYAKDCGFWTLADDSGLEVKTLNGAPGVISARYAGGSASDQDRIDRLLENLSGTTKRAARFISVVALADPHSKIIKVEYGICEGTIIESPRGKSGFGYDPVFIPDAFNSTFAELPSDTKNVISHRGKACLAMHPFLRSLITPP